ncbi:MAG: fibronectin type III domain-containing protein [Clostridiales bacterium]|nr:fibronectin type III domain-containing protein [Clostridiales bacterium]
MRNQMKFIRGFLLCVGMMMIFCMGTESQAVKYMTVTATAETKTTVNVTWKKKKSVTGYIIYRREVKNGKSNTDKFEKIATVSADTKTYKDKSVGYKKRYEYQVKAYKDQKGKMKYLYQGSDQAYVGLENPQWSEHIYLLCETTPKSIKIAGYAPEMQPDVYEIYRKEGSGKYKKIKTIKAKKDFYGFQYVDKKVEKGKVYSYKFRMYKKMDGKKVYSKYSSVIKKAAINDNPTYTMHNYTPIEGQKDALVISLTSAEGNGETLFKYDTKVYDMIPYYNYNNCEKEPIELVPVMYSYDNSNWQPYPEKGLFVSEQQTVYFMFKRKDGKAFDFASEKISGAYIQWSAQYQVGRKDCPWYGVSIDLMNGTVNAKLQQ